MANLDLKKETTWSGFLWYLAPPSGQYYVHKTSVSNRAKSVNTASTIVHNGKVQRYIKPQNKENASCHPHKPFLEDPLLAYL